MSFTTTLHAIINSVSIVTMNGYDLEEDIPHPSKPENMRVELTDGEYTKLEFAPQDVTLDDEGQFKAITLAGEVVACTAHVIAPLTKQALLK